MRSPKENRERKLLLFVFSLFLFLSVSDGFFLFGTLRVHLPLHAVDDEIQAAASGQSTNEDTLSRILQAAADITQESCQMLGIKSVGVDYGLARTGLAVTNGYNPKPLTILSIENATQVCEKVVEICRAEQADRVIVGLPLHKNGTEAEQTNLTRIFAGELATQVMKGLGPNVPVYLFDERYTSKEAAARMHSKNPNSQLYGMLDAEAACIILESYYNDNGIGAEIVQIAPELYDEYERIWQEAKRLEEQRLDAAQKDRDAMLNWRKEAMERDRELELNLGSANKNKKKKKKKKKKK